MRLDSICVQYFQYLTVAWVKMSLYLEQTSAHLHVLIIRKKDILILGKSQTEGVADKYYVNNWGSILNQIFQDQRENLFLCLDFNDTNSL